MIEPRPTPDDLRVLGLRVATVTRAEPHASSREPAIKLWLDLGDLGTVQSSAKLTERHDPHELVGSQVIVVTGFAPLRVGGFRSDVLVLGALTEDGVVLVRPDAPVPPGSEVA